MKKHFDMIIINDGTLGNLELVLKEAWTYIFQDWNSTFRANHVVMINSSNNNFVFDDVSICKAQMAPTIYATGPKSNFFTKYMNYIIGFGVFVLIIFSMIICLCVYVCVVKYKNSKMEKRLEKAEFVQSFNRKASVVMEERLYASSRDLFQIGDKKLMINFESIIGRGASAVVYRGFLQGASPLNTHFKSIETQRFQNCDVAIKVFFIKLM
uniref:Protein kinase domain-containing protein n=1 Tax=Acrobeloides nanus TaxID=290746 RepID=A0A914CWU3_9BILA